MICWRPGLELTSVDTAAAAAAAARLKSEVVKRDGPPHFE
jgi:hypothetical protein